jgi:addiction module RelE/StbE family toxin
MPAAQDDLRAVHAYYAERNPSAADRVVGVILNSANGVATFPLLGRQGVVPGTRERSVTRYPYRIVYHIAGNTIEVLRVIHTARQ